MHNTRVLITCNNIIKYDQVFKDNISAKLAIINELYKLICLDCIIHSGEYTLNYLDLISQETLNEDDINLESELDTLIRQSNTDSKFNKDDINLESELDTLIRQPNTDYINQKKIYHDHDRVVPDLMNNFFLINIICIRLSYQSI